MEFPSPDESLKKLWKEQHDGLEDTLNSIREKAVEEFARENEISRQEAWAVWLMATRPQSKEAMRQELTERIVNMMYDATEAPWDDDYIKARELVNIMLSTSQNPEHRYPTYHYDEELMALSSSDLGKKLFLTPEAMLYLGEIIRSWSYSYSPDQT